MRHHDNHRGTPPNCYQCTMDEEYDKRRKMERKVMKIAKTVQSPEADREQRKVSAA